MGINNQQHFLDYQFGTVITNTLTINDSLIINSIMTANPVEGGTVIIPNYATVVYISNTAPYISVTFHLPSNPKIGKVLSIVTNVDISNVFFTNGNFGTTVPVYILNSQPYRIIFAGTFWIAF